MTSLEIALWLVTVSAVLVHSEYVCGVGTMVDYSPWLSRTGGLRFPQFNKETYVNDPRFEFEESCEEAFLSQMTLCDGMVMDSGCHYCESSNKYVCRRSVDNQVAALPTNETITTLIIADVTAPEWIPNEILSIWKIADSILSKKPTKSWKFTGIIYMDGDEKTGFKTEYRIIGELFSNENRDGYIVNIETKNTDEESEDEIKITGDVYTNNETIGLFILSGQLYVNSDPMDINFWVIYTEINPTSFTFNGTAKRKLELNESTVEFSGEIKTDDEYITLNFTGNVTAEKKFLFRPKVSPFFANISTNNHKERGLTIPETAISNNSINHIMFSNCDITNDFDLTVFKDIRDLKSLTFKRSKVSNLSRAKNLFNYIPTLKAVYFENSIFPDLTIGRPVFSSLEMVSFKESGPLYLNKSTFAWLSNSKLKYMNLANANLQWDSNAFNFLYVLFEPIVSTMEYLDISYSTITENHLKQMFKKLKLKRLSLAGLELTAVPTDALETMTNTLEYLSLRNNHFSKVVDSRMQEDVSILKFPYLNKLKELDMSNCEINLIEAGAFDSLTKLERLYLSQNSIVNIQDGWYKIYPTIRYLDMSLNSASIALKPIIKFGGKDYEDMSRFKYLEILDMSYCSFTENTWTLKGLTKNLIGISLCNSNIEYKNYQIFSNLTNLQVLDISKTINNDIDLIQLIQNLKSLKFLYLRENQISDYFFANLKKNESFILPNLEFISLQDNNLKQIDWNLQQALPNLSILDVSHNSISAWNNTLTNIKNLRTLFINDNKIENITPLMLNDLYSLKVVKVANNPYLCSPFVCQLTNNTKSYMDNYFWCNNTQQNQTKSTRMLNSDDETKFVFEDELLTRNKRSLRDFLLEYSQEIMRHILFNNAPHHFVTNQDVLISMQYKLLYDMEQSTCDGFNLTSEENYLLDNCVWVHDWHSDNYQCYSKSNQSSFSFFSVPNDDCKVQKVKTVNETDYFDMSIVYISTAAILFSVTIVGIVYWKWWYIRYFSVLVKNATVLSFLDKDEEDEIVNYKYDVFVSYSQHDRTWVFDQLIPNLDRNNLTVCFHERDFQVGVSILENIIANLDKSKSIILIISKSFIKSHWCQFEMHLAQHRLIETRRNQLILIFLDYIPRFKRPKTLQYLMVTKTYIEWPADNRSEHDVRTFWNRLDKALLYHCV